ncbi:dihydropyrimidinase [Fusobacterium ulcerans]|uniref:dihydropyrimidinase n=1 Tax=Fusobacterium ulcerans TaxID=861 RepID=UPI001032BC3E|nr:dihydropyrimidinase [Fusobacterium ulcerans]
MLLIKNGFIVSEKDTFKADILIENGKIKKIENDLKIKEGYKVIDAEGKYIIPGAIDAHTHFDLQAGTCRAVDDFYTGSIAAACGGTTTIIDHMAFGPKGCNLQHQVDEYHKLAAGKSVIDYSFHGVIQHVNDDIINEMEKIIKEGIPSLKVYMTYDFKLNDAEILQTLKKAKECNGIIAVHAENHDIINYFREKFLLEGKKSPIYHAYSRPEECEAEAINRMIYLSEIAEDAPLYIVHLSTKKGLEEIKRARKKGMKNIFVETCPQYLLLTEQEYSKENNEGLKFIMSPPLRKGSDIEALWEGINNGDIQVIATDHCPFNFRKEKQFGKNDFTKCPNGAPGVEERVKIIFSEGVKKGRISINKFVEVVCTNPAKIYGCYPQKGVLLPGSDADIVVIDANKKSIITHNSLHSVVDYTLYEGREIMGDIELVIQRGEVIVKNNKFIGKKGNGKFLKRKV